MRAVTQGDRLQAVAAPAFFFRKAAHQPFGQRADGGDPDRPAFQVVGALYRRVVRHDHAEGERRARHGGHGNLGNALGNKREIGSPRDRDVDATAENRLLQLSAALENRDVDIDLMGLEKSVLEADFGRQIGISGDGGYADP